MLAVAFDLQHLDLVCVLGFILSLFSVALVLCDEAECYFGPAYFNCVYYWNISDVKQVNESYFEN